LLRPFERSDVLFELRDPLLERVDPADLARELVDAVLQVVERTERAGAARQVRQALHRLLALAREAADDVVIGGLARRHVIGGLAGRHARSHSTTGDCEPAYSARHAESYD